MSFSWTTVNNVIPNNYVNKKSLKLNNIKTRTPSPTLFQMINHQNSRELKVKFGSFMKKISAVISGETKDWKGSMTVEAAMLLPIILFFFLHLLGVLEMLRVHTKMTMALWECGNTLTVYAALPETISEKIPDVGISYLYVKQHLEEFLGEEYLDASPIVNGKEGINYLSSGYDSDCIDIGVTYPVRPPISIFPVPYTRLVNRYYAKTWTGYQNDPKIQFVYITIYGEVWHARADCSHIFITVQETDREEIKHLRNIHGSKYYSCELCREEEKDDKVYYTNQGERYHEVAECSALVRYVRAVIKDDSLSYPPCGRCAKEE